MSLRVANSIEKNVVVEAIEPIVVAANTTVTVLRSIVGISGEWLGRYIQNVGAGDAYYAFGQNASAVSYNGVLSANTNYPTNIGGQQLDVSNFPGIVTVFSHNGTTIAVTSLKRQDNVQGGASGATGPSNAAI